MSKYYYSDPLEAAWMAKHFDMKLVHYATQDHADEYGCEVGEQWDWKEGCCTDGDKEIQMIQDALAYLEDASPEKIYIHPDSLHILEPQVTDIVTLSNRCYHSTIGINLGVEKAKKHIADGGQIIQRGGIPFHWPKIEQPVRTKDTSHD